MKKKNTGKVLIYRLKHRQGTDLKQVLQKEDIPIYWTGWVSKRVERNNYEKCGNATKPGFQLHEVIWKALQSSV